MLTNKQKRQIAKMGKGWFILKYASEHGITINTNLTYGSDKSMASRNSVYEKTKADHNLFIQSIKQEKWSSKVSAGSPTLNSVKVYSILHAL